MYVASPFVRRSLGLLWVLGAVGVAVAAGPLPADKVAVVDGSIRHDVGELQCHIGNWGLIGSQYSANAPYSNAPSCRWPGAGGREHLWSGGLWVGAVRLGERVVSTCQYETEFLPGPGLDDIPRFSFDGAAGAARYPDLDADDDQDGLVDEDPLDGVDNDADGLVDEDFAAWSDQYIRCEYDDSDSTAYPDHVPLGLHVVQESVQWSDAEHGSAIGLQYVLTNTSPVDLDDVYVGFFADPDVAATDGAGEAQDDFVGSFLGEVNDGDGFVPVEVAYAYDSKAVVESGYLGLLPLGARIGDEEGALEEGSSFRSIQFMRGQLAFDNGGDPVNDDQRYTQLALANSDVPPAGINDYRMTVSLGPFPVLAAGESITVRFALVVGKDSEELIQRAARFRRTYQGAAFDRDGDPSNGAEHVVRWLRPQDIPVPALVGRLAVVEARDDRVLLDLFTNVESLEGLVLEREADETRRWNVARLAVDGGAALLDAEPGAWPRTYRLLADGEQVLDEIRLAAPVPGALDIELFAAPNPFNPSLTVEYGLPAPVVAVLSVYDVAGRLVVRLDEGPREAGLHTVRWDGCDSAGRAASSGAYHLRLEAGGRVIGRTVSLVR